MLSDYFAVLIAATFVLFVVAVVAGIFSKRASYSLGVAASAVGASLALLVLGSGGTYALDLWNITPGNSAQIAVTPLNSFFLLISCLVRLGKRA